MKSMYQSIAGAAFLSLCAGGAWAVGPDVTLSDSTSVSKFGPVGTTLAYAIGSNTCNIGNQNLLWLSDGTPALAMNVYRLANGRIEQLGGSMTKTACCAAAGGSVCGTCNGQGGNVLGAGCLDVYGAGWNAIQSNLKPRSRINAYSGAFTGATGVSGTAITGLCQVETVDVTPASNPGAQWFIEGVYVGSDDAAANNALNNATYKRVTVSSTQTMTPTGSANVGIPAIRAWRDHGGGANIVDTAVTVGQVAFQNEGTFWYAFKPRDNGNGTWRYEYAIFNLNSDAAGGAFEVPVPNGVTVSNLGWKGPNTSHSGEVYNNMPWTSTRTSNSVRWESAQNFATNPNANALRWGWMHNFWFDASTAPAATNPNATLSSFKTLANPSATFAVAAPGAPVCDSIDFNNDNVFPSTEDIDDLLSVYGGGPCSTGNCNDIDINNDGVFPSTDDIDAFLRIYGGGNC